MRHVCILSALTLLLAGSFDSTADMALANDAIPPEVQEAIEEITEFGGQYTLTDANTIRSIRFNDGSELDPEFFDLFAEQEDLESLIIVGYRGLTDATVAKLAGLTNMRELTLTNSGITDAALRTIAESFPNLTRLNVSSNSRLTDASAREIAKLQNLEVLNLLFCDFSELGIVSLSRLPKLRALDIRGNMKIGDGGMATLARLPALRNLEHRSPAVSDEGIRALSQAKTLEHLMIQDMQITGQAGQSISQMERLNSLIIFRCENFDSNGVLALKGLRLNRLTLRGLPVNDSAMEVFAELPTVRRLYLQELFSVTDAGMANIAHLKDLEILDIWEMGITDESMEIIAQLTSLETLMLGGTKVTDAGLEALLAMPQLETVTLTNNPGVSPAMIQKLQDAKKFTVRLQR